MNDWLIWNDVNTQEMGVAVVEQPPITIPEERVLFEEIRGRSGSVATLEGEYVYKDMILSAECILRDPTKFDEVAAWLRGSGNVEFASRPGGYYRARIVNQIELTKVIAADPCRRFTLNFRCQPGWIHNDQERRLITRNGTKLENQGTLPSLPRIEIIGSGDFVLMIDTQTAFLQGITDGIILDSQLGDALTIDGSNLANDHWGGQPLVLNPGINTITWMLEEGASITSIRITPRWMSL